MDKIRVAVATEKAISKFRGEKVSFAEDLDDSDDTDYEVSVPISDLRGVLFNIGGRLTKKEIDALVQVKSVGEPITQISRVEFLRVIMFASLVISIFDRQGNGHITASDLVSAIANFTNSYSEEEIYELVQKVQTNVNGLVTYENFEELVKTTR